jgi:UDP-3-O-acyl-N-acetylglucosamine deacetylase
MVKDTEAKIDRILETVEGQKAQKQLKTEPDLKGKFKLSIPFLFLPIKYEQETTWNLKDVFKDIREDLKRGKTGSWAKAFLKGG